MKLGPINISLAKPTPPKTGVEYGTAINGAVPTILNGEFIDVSKIGPKDFKKMIDVDGTAQGLYNILTMPLIGSNWTIETDEDTPEGKKQAEEVQQDLRMPPHKGGMSTPMELILAQMVRGCLEGYAGFEKVFAVKNGRVTFKKVAWRDPTTITFLTDARGGFNGFKQRAYINGSYGEVVIPLEQAFLYTYGKEFHALKGRSAFTAAYANYDKKRRLYYLNEQQAQADALKTKTVNVKDGKKSSQSELDSTVAAVDQLGFKATVGVPENFEVGVLNRTAGKDLMPAIQHLNGEMARSILAMFMLLGSDSKTGSYSLSQDQSDLFIQALMSFRKTLETHITSYLIPDLYNFNYANPVYGTFKMEDLTDSTIELLKQSFIKIIEKDKLNQEVLNGITQKIADKLEIDTKVVDKAVENEPAEEEPEETPPVDNSRKISNFAAGGWKRELTPAEQKVNFSGIERKLDTLEGEFQREVQPIYDSLVKGAVEKLNKILDDGEIQDVTERALFDENLRNQYVKVIKDQSMDAYTFGKNGAADELSVKAPATPKISKTYFKEQSKSVSDKQFADLAFMVKQEVQKAVRKDQLAKLSTGDVIAAVTVIFADFFKDKMELTAAATVAAAINLGRKDVFKANTSDISLYQYSAILDHRTCPICQDLDGSVVDEQEFKSTSFDPPIHFRCRCIWVAILIDETDQPPVTGIPDDPGGATEPSLSFDLEEKISELGEQAVNKAVEKMLSED